MANRANLGPKALAEQKYKSSRYNLLLMLGFTILNIVLLYFDAGVMMLFSATVPYYSMVFAMMSETGAQLTAFLTISLVPIIVYLICFIFSKKHYAFMIVALVFFSLDTLALVALFAIAFDVSGILDLAVHIWVLYYLITGITNGYKLKKLPDDPEIEQQSLDPELLPKVQAGDSTPTRMADTEVKARILLETDAVGKHIVYRRVKRINELVINGYIYDELEAIVESAHRLVATVDGNLIEAGFDGGINSYLKVNGEKVATKKRFW